MNESPNRVKRKMPEPLYRPSPITKSHILQTSAASSSSTPNGINEVTTTSPALPSSPSRINNPISQRIIHHSHTNSLPIPMMPHQVAHPQHHPTMMPSNVVSHPSGFVNQNINPYHHQQQQNYQHHHQTTPTNGNGPYYQYPNPNPNIQQQPGMYANQIPKQGSQTTETFPSPSVSSIQPQHVKTFSLPVSFDGGPGPNGSMSNAGSTMLPPPIRQFNSHGDIPLPPGWDFQQAPNGQIYYIK